MLFPEQPMTKQQSSSSDSVNFFKLSIEFQKADILLISLNFYNNI